MNRMAKSLSLSSFLKQADNKKKINKSKRKKKRDLLKNAPPLSNEVNKKKNDLLFYSYFLFLPYAFSLSYISPLSSRSLLKLSLSFFFFPFSLHLSIIFVPQLFLYIFLLFNTFSPFLHFLSKFFLLFIPPLTLFTIFFSSLPLFFLQPFPFYLFSLKPLFYTQGFLSKLPLFWELFFSRLEYFYKLFVRQIVETLVRR